MEAAGLTVGVVALTGLFNNAVDCFEYIQLGRNFSKGFQTNLLKLDSVRLRLSRWGECIGIGSDMQKMRSFHQAMMSTQDIRQAEGILGQVFDNAHLLLCDPKGDLDRVTTINPS